MALRHTAESLGGWKQTTAPPPHGEPSGIKGGLSIYLSNNFPGDPDAAGLGTTLLTTTVLGNRNKRQGRTDQRS